MGVNYQHYFLNNYYFSTVWNYSLNKYLLSATNKPGSVLADGDTLLNKTNATNVLIKREHFWVLSVPEKKKNTQKLKNKTRWYVTVMFRNMFNNWLCFVALVAVNTPPRPTSSYQVITGFAKFLENLTTGLGTSHQVPQCVTVTKRLCWVGSHGRPEKRPSEDGGQEARQLFAKETQSW